MTITALEKSGSTIPRDLLAEQPTFPHSGVQKSSSISKPTKGVPTPRRDGVSIDDSIVLPVVLGPVW